MLKRITEKPPSRPLHLAPLLERSHLCILVCNRLDAGRTLSLEVALELLHLVWRCAEVWRCGSVEGQLLLWCFTCRCSIATLSDSFLICCCSWMLF